MGKSGEYYWAHDTNLWANILNWSVWCAWQWLCVSKEIAALLGFGVYNDSLIKKSKYLPKGVPGDSIDQYLSYKDVTYVDMLESITEDGPEGKAFNIFFFKEP